MDATELLADAYGRIRDGVRAVVDGLDAEALTWAPDGGVNTIAWLTWHLTRIQDDHVADATDTSQVWVEDTDWTSRFGLTPGTTTTGYGHDPDQVRGVRPTSPDVVVAYHDAVAHRTLDVLARLDDTALDRVVDEGWDPPVTFGARLVSVVQDDLKHLGQAEYLRGLLSST